jgi:hypothetical protein
MRVEDPTDFRIHQLAFRPEQLELELSAPLGGFVMRKARTFVVLVAAVLAIFAVSTLTFGSSWREAISFLLPGEVTAVAAPSNQMFGVVACGTGGPIEVASSGGTTTPTAYATLKLAFDSINAGTHTGSINIFVCSNTTETATAALNSGAVAPASYTSITIRPFGGARIIEGSIVGAVVKLNGADNVTIDGRQNGTGSARDLTVRNNNTSAATAAIWLASVAAGNGASNNVIRNLEVAAGTDSSSSSTSASFGIIMCGTTISVTANGVDNDNNSFIANRVIRARYGIVTRGTTTDLNINPIVTDNIVGPSAFGSDQIGKVGIFMQADTGALVSRNTVQFVGCLDPQACTGADRMGIAIGNESWSAAPGTITSNTYTVTKNTVHDIIDELTFSSLGIDLATTGGGTATNNLVANNFIYNVRANGTSGDMAVGLGIAGGLGDSVVFNSISMTGDVDPGVSGASTNYGSGIRIANASGASHGNLTLMNNSVYMDLSSSSTATVRYYAISGNAAAYAFGTGGENYNNYYINAANPQSQTGGLGSASGNTLTTQFATLANWQTAYTAVQDANSIQADPLYASATSDLHLLGASPNVNVALAIGSVTDDIDGQVRPNGVASDIGADEFYALPGTLQLSSSSYGGNEGATVSATVTRVTGSTGTVGVTYTLADGSATGGASCTPGVDYVNPGPQTLTFNDGVASQPISVTLCSDLSIDASETFSITLSNPTGGASLGSPTVATATITDVPPPFNGTYDVGAGQSYTSLTNTGGIFEAINLAGATGNVTINIVSDLSGETGTVALNEVAGGFSVTIKPTGASRTITGSSANSIIRLNGADNVTIDGSLTGGTATGVGGTPSLRNLTVQNTNTTATAGAVIAVIQGPNSANNNTIKNVNVVGQDPTQTLIGIHIGGNAIGSPPTVASNNNAVVDNCSFKRSFIAVLNDGVSAAIPATGSVISHNDISATGADRMRRAGIFVFNQNGIQITENSIGGIVADEAADAIGIIAGIQFISATATTSGGVFNAIIAKNKISGISSTNTTGFSAVGIAIAGDPLGENFIGNNMISGVSAPATSPDIVAGIFIAGVASSNTHAFYNSVANTGARGAVASQIGSYGIAISGTNPVVELKDNIFYNTQTSAGGANAKSYAIGMTTTTFTNLSSNFNDFYSSGANAAGFRTGSLDTTGTDLADITAWRTATSQDANSLAVDPTFVDPVLDLHLLAGSPMINAGTVIGLISDDIDGNTRGATVDIGADEFVPPNTAPTITAAVGVTRQAGSPVSNSTIATVTDAESGNGAVTVTVTSANPSNGVTISNIVNTGGTITADVVAACGATNASFTLQASDGSLTANDTLNVTVNANTPPTLTYANASVASGGSTTVNPATGPGDNGSVATIAVQSTGTYTGTISVDNTTGVVSVSNAAPVGSHTITIRATDNCATFTDATFTLDVTPAGGPVTVTATAGTPGPTNYPTLKDAIDAINAGTHQGDITVAIVTSTTEPATSVLNGSGAGTAAYTSVLIRPVSDGVTVAGPSAQGRGLIELNGADNVTIDGDNPGTAGTNRNLTLQNTATNTTTFTSVVRLALATTVITSTDDVTIKNLNILGSSTGRNIPAATSTTASENTTFGIFAGPGASTVSNTTAPSPVASVSTSVAAGATATNLLVNNNAITTAARAVSMNGAATSVFPGLQITGNTIGNQTTGAVDQVTSIGITAQGSANGVISGNTVWVEGYVRSSAATHAINVGVNSANGTFTIDSNRVNRARNNDGQTWSAFGINLAGGSNHIVQNNFISGMMNDQTAGTGGFGTTFGAYGIRIASGTGHKIYHNSVHLYGALAGVTSTDLSAAFLMTATSQTGVDVRNNIFSNQITGGNPTGTRHVAVFLPSGATSAMNLTFNNNAYFGGTDALSRLAQVGATFGTGEYLVGNFDPTSTTPATNFRAYTSSLSAAGTNDNASFATLAPPPFTSNVNLHIPAATATRLESGGTAVGVTVDIDTDTRNATTPDIGADEFAGLPPLAHDMQASTLITPANGALILIGQTFSPQATFTNNGTATETSVTVRYKIIDPSTATIYNQTAVIPTIAPLQNVLVTFPSTSLSTAGVHTIQASSELAGDLDPSNDTKAGSVTAVPPLGTTIDVGSGQTYTSLTNPGGLFQALNASGISGNTTINITSDLTGETGAILLNQIAEVGAGGYTLTIKPSGAPRTISGTPAAGVALIALNGADRVIIDGSLAGGTDRSLTITNGQTGTTTVIWIRSQNASNGSNNNTIKNCVINGTLSGTAMTTAGILTGSGTTLGNDAEAPNSNNTIQNNWIYRVQNSMYLRGGLTPPVFDQNWVVTGNELGSAVMGDKNLFRGMLIGNSANFTISGNTVHGIQSSAATGSAMSGIQFALLVSNGSVTNNVISDIKNISASGTGAFGMQISSSSAGSNVTIANNFVTDVATNGLATVNSNGFGMMFNGSGGGYNVYFNSVNMNTNQTAGTVSAAINVNTTFATAGALNVRNNIFANTQTTGTRYAVYSTAAASVFAAISYNDYLAQNIGFIGGSARATLADWQTATTQDANSVAVDPLFMSSSNLHLQSGSPVRNLAVAGTGIATDIDGDPRDGTPDMGADETTFVGVPGSLQFSSATYSTGEGAGTATITVTRTGGSDGTVGVNYATSNGTATGGASCAPGVDFVNTSGTLTFLNGVTSQTFNVTLCNDATDEPDETINYGLSNATGGATIGTPSTAVQTIVDDDAPGTITVNDVRVTEGNLGTINATFTLTYAGFDPANTSVQYATANGTATAGTDYAAASGTVSFGGPITEIGGIPTTTRTVTVPVNGEITRESNETFFLNLSNAVNATITDGQGVGIIVDDDRAYVADFDADRHADYSVYRPGENRWYVHRSTDGVPNVFDMGAAGDIPVPGDYDVDGKADYAVWRPSTGQWIVRLSGAQIIETTVWGTNGDKPVQGDYDGDGRTDLAIFRPSTGEWWIRRSSNGTTLTQAFGLATDKLVQGDYDGDFKTDIAVYRNGMWYILQSSNGSVRIQNWGTASDRPVSGDFDGDGANDLAIYRDGQWWILNSLTGTSSVIAWGLATDIPSPADFDADGTTDVVVFRPSTGDWYVLRSSNTTITGEHWGQSGDAPTPAAYLPQ